MSPTRDNNSFVTRGRTYGIFADQVFDDNDTAGTAAAILHLMGPDPDAISHLMELKRSLGYVCTIDGCELPHRSLGLCVKHLGRHKRATQNEAHTINRTTKQKAALT